MHATVCLSPAVIGPVAASDIATADEGQFNMVKVGR